MLPTLKILVSCAMVVATVGLFVALSAWLPFAPARLRHGVRHWARVEEAGCPRCERKRSRVCAEVGAEQAFVGLSRRILARAAFGRVAAL